MAGLLAGREPPRSHDLGVGTIILFPSWVPSDWVHGGQVSSLPFSLVEKRQGTVSFPFG